MSTNDAYPLRSQPLIRIESPGVAARRRERTRVADVAAAQTAMARAEAARDAARRQAEKVQRTLGWLPFARGRIERADGALAEREMDAVGAADRVDTALREARLVQFPTVSKTWDYLERDFEALAQSDRLWDETHYPPLPPAGYDRDLPPYWMTRRMRVPVVFSRRALPEYGGAVEALWLQNANGPELYLFPDLFVLRNEDGETAAVDLREVEAHATRAPTTEEGTRPADAEYDSLMGVTVYGKLTLQSTGGLDEAYLVSDLQKAKQFAYALETHQKAVRQWYADRGL